MKILLVVDQFDSANNGTTISAIRFAQALKEHGNEVKVVSTGEPGEDKYIVKELPLIPIVRHIVHSQGMCFGVPKKKTFIEAMQGVDIVHFYMPFGLSVHGLKVAKELGIPVTSAFHMQPENITYTLGLGKSTKVNDMIYNFYRKKFYNQFDHVHCPSEFIARELEKHGYTAKLHVISNGIDKDFVYRKLPKSEQLDGKFVITMIGRYSNEKRQDLLIDAIYKSKYSDKIQLVLAGKGLKESSYREQAKKLKYEPIMQFFTKVELMDLLAMTDLYVHSADAEIEAISCIEAFSSGLVPIIANSSKSATPQFALDDRSLFEAGNSLDLASKIDYWIENEDERKKMEINYAESGKKYNIVNSIVQIEEMFREAINDCKKAVY